MSSTCFSRPLVPLGLCIFLVLFHGCLSQLTTPCKQTQKSSRLSGRSDCQIDRIIAREPNRRVESEAGVSEFWDSFENDELECAGVEAVRHTINPKGLLLPYYPSAPELVYVIRGRGLQGTVLPGCPETFETSFPSGSGQQQFSDKHQKVYRYNEGDILALPAGSVHWTYNDGETPIVAIVLRDTSNVANQLDRNFRKFFLAGNPQSQQVQYYGQGPGQQQPWGQPGSQQGPSFTPGQQQPWGQPGSQQGPWGTQRPSGGQGQQPWQSQRPSGSQGQQQQPWQTQRPSSSHGQQQQPWQTQRPSGSHGQQQQPWETQRPSGSHGQQQQPWETQRPSGSHGQQQQPWETQRPSGSHGQQQQPWETQRPSGSQGQQPWQTQRPSGSHGQQQQPWETQRPSGSQGQQPWQTQRPSSHGQQQQPWETQRPSGSQGQQPWQTQRPSGSHGQQQQPWETQRPSGSQGQQPWQTQRPSGSHGQQQQPWQTQRPSGSGSQQQPSGSQGQQQPWGSQRPMGGSGQQADPCEVCRRLRGSLGLDSPCAANCNAFRMQQGQADQGFNIFNGFDEQILQMVFNVEYETVTKLQGQYDNRGLIVRAENFQVVVPEEQQQQQFSPRGRGNGFEETLCSTQLSANIASPTRADVYNPRGGRISKLNSFKLPVLNMLQLSAERGVLYKNAVLAPHYNLNAHSIIYITSGSSRLQIVRHDGSSVFDDIVREGQLIVVPQDFAVIKKASEEGCEWIAFKTNENAMTTQLAGRFSYIRELPEEVLVNSYDISRQQAKSLKYNRQEGVVLSPQSGSTITKAKNTLLNAIFG